MDKSEVIKLLSLLSANEEASDCLKLLKNDKGEFKKGFSKPKEELASLYTLRLTIAKDVKREKFHQSEIDSWENAVKLLNQSKAKDLHLNTLLADPKSYFLFWDLENKDLVASICLIKKDTF